MMHNTTQAPTTQPSGAWDRTDYVNEYENVSKELERYREREKHCATMNEAEKLALIRTIQEIGDVVFLSGLSSSPAEIVAAVKNLQKDKSICQTALENIRRNLQNEREMRSLAATTLEYLDNRAT